MTFHETTGFEINFIHNGNLLISLMALKLSDIKTVTNPLNQQVYFGTDQRIKTASLDPQTNIISGT